MSRWTPLIFILGLLNLQGCGAPLQINEPKRPALLPSRIEMVQLVPFTEAADLNLPKNGGAFFFEHLKQQISLRPWLHILKSPPARNDRAVVLKGHILHSRVYDRRGKITFLRTVVTTLQMRVLKMDGKDLIPPFVQKVVLEKVFIPPRSPQAPIVDISTAAKEVIMQTVQHIFPLAGSDPIVLETAKDPLTKQGVSHFRLIKGNEYAMQGDFKNATDQWIKLLFDPSQPRKEERYRFSPGTIDRLKKKRLPEELIEKLILLQKNGEMTLAKLSGKLKTILPETQEMAGVILREADFNKDRLHLNMAAAHANLAQVAWNDKIFFRAAYHMSRAYSHYPHERLGKKWLEMQISRGLVDVRGGKEPKLEEWLENFLIIQGPQDLKLLPGSVEQDVLPLQVFASIVPSAPSTKTEARIKPSKKTEEVKTPVANTGKEKKKEKPTLKPDPSDSTLPPIEEPEYLEP